MESSLFRESASRSLLPHYEHELPVLGGPAIPPPVTSSMTGSGMISSLTHRTRLDLSEPQLLALQRHEKQIQQDLQVLLDAQSEGLIAGLAPDSRTGNVSESSSVRSTSAAGARPSPLSSPSLRAKRRLGLRSARRGILEAMQELASIKGEEYDLLGTEDESVKAVLEQVHEWEKKKGGIQRELGRIESSEAGSRLRRLEGEEGNLQHEIHDLETRLYELKAKHRHLASEISQLQNSLQAKESSYKASLSLLESEIKRFLERPPLKPSRSASSSDRSTTFYDLNPNRRTLDLANDHFREEHESLSRSRDHAGVERDALEDGSAVWSDVVAEVTAFERRLRAATRKLGGPTAPLSSDNSPRDNGNLRRDHMASIGMSGGTSPAAAAERDPGPLLTQMSQSINQLSSKLSLARARDWKLLECCIGAELEAFKRGREILMAALGPTAPDEGTDPKHDTSPALSNTAGQKSLPDNAMALLSQNSPPKASSNFGSPEVRDRSSSTHSLHKTERSNNLSRVQRESSIETDGAMEYTDALERSSDDDEDDEPHPDLLVSKPEEA